MSGAPNLCHPARLLPRQATKSTNSTNQKIRRRCQTPVPAPRSKRGNKEHANESPKCSLRVGKRFRESFKYSHRDKRKARSHHASRSVKAHGPPSWQRQADHWASDQKTLTGDRTDAPAMRTRNQPHGKLSPHEAAWPPTQPHRGQVAQSQKQHRSTGPWRTQHALLAKPAHTRTRLRPHTKTTRKQDTQRPQPEESGRARASDQLASATP